MLMIKLNPTWITLIHIFSLHQSKLLFWPNYRACLGLVRNSHAKLFLNYNTNDIFVYKKWENIMKYSERFYCNKLKINNWNITIFKVGGLDVN